jgi:hypothetical protein
LYCSSVGSALVVFLPTLGGSHHVYAPRATQPITRVSVLTQTLSML